jgi:hypothetical protein
LEPVCCAVLVSEVDWLLDYRRKTNRKVIAEIVQLNSPGGSMYAAMELGRILRRANLPVSIERGRAL